MAGSYPNVPSRRMAWDADGCVSLYWSATTAAVELNASEQVEFNDEDYVKISPWPTLADFYVGVIFPELREIDGYVFVGDGNGTTSSTALVEGSGDTTNGRDGLWSTIAASYSWTKNGDLTSYRTDIQTAAVSNQRGIRLNWDSWDQTGPSVDEPVLLHLYGTIATGETPDRLLWVDNATGSEFGLPIDYGDIPRGSAEDTEVKLRNNSGTLTASSVQVTAEALYLASGSWYTFKEAGGSFQATLPLASSIGAGADSPVLTVRRITPDAETLGLHAGRAFASVGSWS